MPSFSYTAINEAGQEISGSVDATDEKAAERTLEGQGLMPLKIGRGKASAATKTSVKSFGSSKPKKGKKITLRETIDFTRQLVTLLKAGVPILTSLETPARAICRIKDFL